MLKVSASYLRRLYAPCAHAISLALLVGLSLLPFDVRSSDDIKKSFNLPADTADTSLKRFSQQSGNEVLFASHLVRGVRTNPVTGLWSAREAIDRMLHHTGLVAVHDTTTGAFSVRKEPTSEKKRPDPSSTTPPPRNSKGGVSSTDRTMTKNSFFSRLAAATLLLLSPSTKASESTGVLTGRVFNARSGLTAERARVSIENTTLVTFTDADGHYLLANVPSGSVQLRVFYTGFAPHLETVSVVGGKTTEHDLTLSASGATSDPAIVKLDAFVVGESREMEASAIAINEQRFAANVKNVVSTDEFGAVAEGNVADFLRFLPGVTVDLSGGDARTVSIDGAPAANTPITFAGLNLPSSNDTGRQVEVGMFNLNNVSRIEVSLSPTPDSPGSALAGSVNLVPRSSFERTRPVFNGSTYLMMRDDFIKFGRQAALYRDPRRVVHPGFDFSWVVPVNKRFGFSVAMGRSAQYSHQIGHLNTWRGLNAATNGNAFPDTPSSLPYLSAYQINNAPKETTRESLGLTLDFKVSDYDRISVSYQYTGFDAWTAARNLQFNPTRIVPGTFTPTYVQGVVNAGNLVATSGGGRVRQNRIHLPTFNWRHDGPIWKFDGGVGRAEGSDTLRSMDKGLVLTAVARRTGVTVGFDQITPERPGIITVTDGATGAAVNPFRLENYSLASVSDNPIYSGDTNFSAFVNARRDFHGAIPLSLRAGLDVRQSSRELRSGAYTWAYTGANVRGSAAPFVDATFAQRKGPYGFPEMQFVDYKGVFDHFKANPSQFTFDENANYRALVSNSKHAQELISSAYLRGDASFFSRRLLLVGGVRFEQTNIEAEGPLTDLSRNVRRDANGNPLLDAGGNPQPITNVPLEVSKLTLLERAAKVDKEYLRIFPSLNASLNLTEKLILRGAVSNAIGRPDFDQYTSGLSLPDSDLPPTPSNRIVVNNAGIKPWTATSYRVRLEYYFKGVGQLAVGGFRRDYDNFFGNTIFPATPEFLNLYGLNADEYGTYDVSTQYNVPGAVRTTGWDVSYKQALTFLPPWARGIQVFGNISFRRMKADDLGSLGFNEIPHSGAWGISLTRPRFNVRMNVGFRAAQRQGAVTAAGIEAGTYNYTPSRNTIDLLGEYRIRRNTSVFMNLRNVTDVPGSTITRGPNTPTYAQLRQQQRYGSLWTFGLKGTF